MVLHNMCSHDLPDMVLHALMLMHTYQANHPHSCYIYNMYVCQGLREYSQMHMLQVMLHLTESHNGIPHFRNIQTANGPYLQ